MIRRGGSWLLPAALLYLVLPGHPDVTHHGLPLGQAGFVALLALIGAWWWLAGVPSLPIARTATLVVTGAAAAKLAIAMMVTPSGWLAQYHATPDFTGRIERSTDFPDIGATRIDPQLSFEDTTFPVHFFNDIGFNAGFRRESTEPFSVRWRGYLETPDPMTLSVEARGRVEVRIDDRPAELPATVAPGAHVIEVRYAKPANTDGLFRLGPGDAGGTRPWRLGEVTPWPASTGQRRQTRVLAVVALLLHGLVACALAVVLPQMVVAKSLVVMHDLRRRGAAAAGALAIPLVMLLATLQGLWQSRHLVGRVWSLTGGDDWWAFEALARDALLNGPLVNGSGVPGPFNVYPGYIYLVAAVHRVVGESLAGVVLTNFVLLGAATVFVYRLAREFVSPRGALFALGWLLVLEQMAFVRYYTVTLLSENLFFPLVAATVYFLVRHDRDGAWGTLCGAAVCGGLATVTRPTLLLYLPVAMVFAGVAAHRRHGPQRAPAAALVLAVLWMASISPITLRNYLVSGDPVLVTAGQGRTFIDYNAPPGDDNAKYYENFTGSNLSALKTLLWILWDHPRDTLAFWGVKVGFSLGMVHWRGSAVHPELILTSLLYAAAIALCPVARSRRALIVHAFIATHMLTLLLSVPWNYGYRMLLAMYLVMPVFAAGAMSDRIAAWRHGRAAAVTA
jgi:hypothetical protein